MDYLYNELQSKSQSNTIIDIDMNSKQFFTAEYIHKLNGEQTDIDSDDEIDMHYLHNELEPKSQSNIIIDSDDEIHNYLSSNNECESESESESECNIVTAIDLQNMNDEQIKQFYTHHSNDDDESDDSDYEIYDSDYDAEYCYEKKLRNNQDWMHDYVEPDAYQPESDDYNNDVPFSSDTSDDDDDEEKEEKYDGVEDINDNNKNGEYGWIRIAKGVDSVCDAIRKGKHFKPVRRFFKKYIRNKNEIRNYIGKNFEQTKARNYIRRFKFDNDKVSLRQSIKNPNVFQFDNVQSKHISGKKYSLLLNFNQIILYVKSLNKLYSEQNGDDSIEIDEDEMHWYKWLQNQDAPVSSYLDEKYHKREQILDKRRKQRLKKSRNFYYGQTNINKLNKNELVKFAKKHLIDIPKNEKGNIISAKELKIYLILQLKNSTKTNQQPLQCMNKSSPCSCYKKSSTKKPIQCKNPTRICCVNCQHHFCSIHCNQKLVQQHISDCQQNINNLSSKESLTLRNEIDKKHRKAKSWYDLDFKLFNSQLSRLQQRCCCKSGAQLPGCCAHVGAILWLIFWCIFSGIEAALKLSKRDLQIRKSLINLRPFCDQQRKAKAKSDRWCPKCHTLNESEIFINCTSCARSYHIKCVNMNYEQYQNENKISRWHCEACTSWDAFVVRNT